MQHTGLFFIKNMSFLKISFTAFFLFALVGKSTCVTANSVTTQLQLADSLFKAEKYTEAFSNYEAIWTQRKYSPQMLLKMAYVKEALGDQTKALYFLNLYYRFHPDTKTLNKIRELADSHDLTGYTFDDYEYFASVYHRYYNEIAFGGIFLGLLGIALLYWQKRRGGDIMILSTFLGIFLIIFFVGFNFGFSINKGIILNEQVFVMSAPSAGADKLTTLSAGHRVKVLEKHDIWYKVEWQDREAYIRETNLLIIQ